MFSRSCFNLLSLDDYSIKNEGTRLPRLMNVPGILSDFDDDSNVELSGKVPGRRIIVANKLPVKGWRDEETRKWSFEWDEEVLVSQLRDGFSPEMEVIYVGCLEAEILDPSEQDEVSQVLLSEYKCVPTFLSPELMNQYYHGFCKHYLWPLFHYLLPVTRHHGTRFDRSMWKAYAQANRVFADKIYEVINPEEDYVWVHDYHLVVLPTILRKKFNKIKLGFFLHSTFPSSEIYLTLPVREEILRGFLNCDLVGFQTYDYARHFLSCCSRMLGLDYQSKRGYIGLDYYGRTVSIKIHPVGVHMKQLHSIMSMPETARRILELKEQFKGKIVMLGVDDTDMFKGVSLKFEAFRQLLDENPPFRGRVVLVQVLNPARSHGRDVQEVQDEMNGVADRVNDQYGSPGYEPIVRVHGPVSTLGKVAYYAIADCVVVNPLRDGMNLVPYKYTVSRQGSEDLDKVLGVDSSEGKKSVIIVSEFVGCSPSLSGAIRINPWNITSVVQAMVSAIVMSDCEKELRHEKHYKYVSSHDVAYWTNSFNQDMERACSEHDNKRCWGTGFGLNSRVVFLGPNFRRLSMETILSAYNQSHSRLILLDYDGTMMPHDLVNKSPTAEIIKLLNGLCSDPKNVVFIVSGRGKEPLNKWFSSCERLGLSAEHGYFTSWSRDSPWETRTQEVNMDWSRIALPVMEHYTEATDGSSIEQKESAIVWHYSEADPDFGTMQAKELLDHLQSVLANEPVVVKRGQQIVEVKPQGVSKGIVVETLMEAKSKGGKPSDFVLCIGDDRSDEDMFESINNHHSLRSAAKVFACTVGQKPSMAKYYLDDTCEVIDMLQMLALASAEHLPKPSVVDS